VIYGDVSRFPIYWRFALALSDGLNAPGMNCWHFLQVAHLVLLCTMVPLAYMEGSKAVGVYERLDIAMEELDAEAGQEAQEGEDMQSIGKPKRVWNSKALLSNLSIQWVDDIVKLGNIRQLEIEDCVALTGEDGSAAAEERLVKAWEKEKERALKVGRKASVTRAFVRAFAFEYFVYNGGLRLLRILLNLFSVSFLLPTFLTYVKSKDEGQNYLDGLLIALAMTVSNIIQLFVGHQFAMMAARTGLRMKSSYTTLVYAKVLRLRASRLPVGEIVNLVSNDGAKFAEMNAITQNLWMGVLEILLTVVLLLHTMGVATLSGVSILVVFLPLQGIIGKVISKVKATAMKTVDQRVRLMSEILTAIKLIKLYAWESSECPPSTLLETPP